ncbi:MAG TPA: hypothetical protein ENN55_03975 [Firmicutes bacterium]|nr:hypothetical protein [Bacillota bacterium]
MLRIILIISFFFGLSGLLLIIDSYQTRISADAAYNDIAFYRSLPTLISKNDKIPLGRFYEKSVPEKNLFIKGYVAGDYYNNRISTRHLTVKTTKLFPPFIEIQAIIDARERK